MFIPVAHCAHLIIDLDDERIKIMNLSLGETSMCLNFCYHISLLFCLSYCYFLFCIKTPTFSFPADLKYREKHTYDFHTEKTLSLPTSIMCKILRHVALMYHFKCKVLGTRRCWSLMVYVHVLQLL